MFYVKWIEILTCALIQATQAKVAVFNEMT